MQKFVQQPTNLYIKWQRSDITEQDLKNAFTNFGQVTSICVRENNETNDDSAPLKFAFVNFALPEDAKNALTTGKNHSALLGLLDKEWHKSKEEFLYYAQNKTNRMSYLKAKRKKKMEMSSATNINQFIKHTMKNNPMMQKQIYKLISAQMGPGGKIPGMMMDDQIMAAMASNQNMTPNPKGQNSSSYRNSQGDGKGQFNKNRGGANQMPSGNSRLQQGQGNTSNPFGVDAVNMNQMLTSNLMAGMTGGNRPGIPPNIPISMMPGLNQQMAANLAAGQGTVRIIVYKFFS